MSFEFPAEIEPVRNEHRAAGAARGLAMGAIVAAFAYLGHWLGFQREQAREWDKAFFYFAVVLATFGVALPAVIFTIMPRARSLGWSILLGLAALHIAYAVSSTWWAAGEPWR